MVSVYAMTPSFRAWGIILGVFAIGFVPFPLYVVGTGFEYLPGDLVDSRLNNYILEHGYRYITGLEFEFWHVRMFYPARWITAFSDAHVGMLPVYAIFRGFGCSPESAYQGYFLIPFALNYFACVWAIRRLGYGPYASSMGAYLFAFALPLATWQTQHAQLGPRFLVPVAMVLAWEWIWKPTNRKLAGLLLSIVGQMYLTLYVGYFLVIVLFLQVIVVGCLYCRSLPWRAIVKPGWKVWLQRCGIVLLADLLLLPLCIPYMIATDLHASYSTHTVREFCPTPRAWVNPAHLSWYRDELRNALPVSPDLQYPAEKELFPGWIASAALLAGLVLIIKRRASPVVVIAASTVLASVLFTTRFDGFALYDPLIYLPGTTGMRAVSRIGLVLLFPLAILVAGASEYLLRISRRYSPLVAMAFFGLLIADHWLVSPNGYRGNDWAAIHYPKSEAVSRREKLCEEIRRHPNPSLLYCFPDPDATIHEWLNLQLDAMWAAQQMGIPTINGWSGYWPYYWYMFAGYAELVPWLLDHHRWFSYKMLAGLVLIGNPNKTDPIAETLARSRLQLRLQSAAP